jgi:hypothetical protein
VQYTKTVRALPNCVYSYSGCAENKGSGCSTGYYLPHAYYVSVSRSDNTESCRKLAHSQINRLGGLL